MFSKTDLKERGISPFVAKAIEQYPLPPGSLILDIPCGYGRHSKWLKDCGHKVIAADIAVERILSFTSLADWMIRRGCSGVELDANAPLPFPPAYFDAALTIDFVSLPLLAQIASYLKPGGLFIYQTMSARGENWRELPQPGKSLEILNRDFVVLKYMTHTQGPTKSESETVSAICRRK